MNRNLSNVNFPPFFLSSGKKDQNSNISIVLLFEYNEIWRTGFCPIWLTPSCIYFNFTPAQPSVQSSTDTRKMSQWPDRSWGPSRVLQATVERVSWRFLSQKNVFSCLKGEWIYKSFSLWWCRMVFTTNLMFGYHRGLCLGCELFQRKLRVFSGVGCWVSWKNVFVIMKTH